MTNREKLLAEVERLRTLLLDDEGFGMASWHIMYSAALERVAEWSPNHIKNFAASSARADVGAPTPSQPAGQDGFINPDQPWRRA